jgi:hypothetical protein
VGGDEGHRGGRRVEPGVQGEPSVVIAGGAGKDGDSTIDNGPAAQHGVPDVDRRITDAGLPSLGCR